MYEQQTSEDEKWCVAVVSGDPGQSLLGCWVRWSDAGRAGACEGLLTQKFRIVSIETKQKPSHLIGRQEITISPPFGPELH
ncbi:hypothetical protein O3P69_012389 [Scylla paramamosain]|uniref:Uncharacterized protein n=1 Tax=Scylla paramamosain TaxID=85552 RepID=A0AAW0SFA9_SCYPA